MPAFRYTAVNAQGQNTSGVADFPDKNALAYWLTQKQMYLVSWHEVGPVVPEKSQETKQPQEAKPSVKAPEAASIPEREKESRFQMPEMGPVQFAIIAGIFVFCVLLGYLVGR